MNQREVTKLGKLILDRRKPANRPFIIGISGFGGSGKTSLAGKLSEILEDTQTIHFDDFVTKERLYEPLENWECFDRERLERQVLEPARNDRPIRYQKLIWRENKLGSPETVPPCTYLIVEGISIWHPGLEHYYDYKVWVNTAPDMAAERGRQRENGNGYEVYWDLWRQNEARYLAKYHQNALADFMIDNG
jgi:uridine kinase